MRHTLKLVALLLVAALPASTHSRPRESEPERLAKLLSGKVAGKPQSCISRWEMGTSEVIDGSVIFRQSARRIFKNETRGGCEARRIGEGLVFRTNSSGLCRGDVAEIVDFQTGIYGGHCVLGDFIPYSAPPKG